MAAVTIGMPIFNGDKYIDGALSKITSQSFSDMEILISDNASFDNTPEILKKWMEKDSRIRIVRQEKNIGAINNFKWLLENASSEWFMFASCDDNWSANYVEDLYKIANLNKNITLSAPSVCSVDMNGKEINKIIFPELLVSEENNIKKIKKILQIVRSGWYYGLYKRERILPYWVSSTKFPFVWGQDFIVLLPLILNNAIVGSSDAMFYQRQTGASEKKYVPQSWWGRLDMYLKFQIRCMFILFQSDRSLYEKIYLLPNVVKYAGRRSWPLLRLAREAARILAFR